MARKVGGKANGRSHGLALHILDPAQFETIDDVRRFVEQGAFGRVGCAIREVLCPDDGASTQAACGSALGDQARLAAFYLIEDLEEIAKAASRGAFPALRRTFLPAFDEAVREEHRRALLFVALASGKWSETVVRELFARLAPERPVQGEPPGPRPFDGVAAGAPTKQGMRPPSRVTPDRAGWRAGSAGRGCSRRTADRW